MAVNPWIPLIEITGTFTKPEELPELNSEQLIEKAAKALASAKNEITYGKTIRDLLINEKNRNDSHRSLATIGLWHFECGVELFRKAIRNYERAGESGLTQERQKEVEIQLRECKKQLTAAAKQKGSAAELLHSVGEQDPVTTLEKTF